MSSSEDQKPTKDEDVKTMIEKKVIEHVVRIEGEKKDDQTKNNQLKALSLKLLENERDSLSREAERLGDSALSKEIGELGNDPETIEYYRGKVEMLEELKPSKPTGSPKGKMGIDYVPSLSGQSSSPYDSANTTQELISKIYDDYEIQLWNRTHNVKEFDENLFKDLDQRRNRILSSLREGELLRTHKTEFSCWQCPCGNIVVNSSRCEKCQKQYKDYSDKPNVIT